MVIKRREKKEYTVFTCRIEKDILDQIRSIVVENDLKSVNQFINDCIRFAVENVKEEQTGYIYLQIMKMKEGKSCPKKVLQKIIYTI